MVRITADRHVCVGAGQCVMLAPETFDQDDDGIVLVLAAELDADTGAAARQAAELCPSRALSLEIE